MSVSALAPGAQVFTIPVVNVPQSFSIPLAGVTYNLVSKWNAQGGFWALDIQNENNIPIVSNVPMITGCDILRGLDYLNIGGSIYVITNGDTPLAPPTEMNLGVEANLYFVTVNGNG